MSETLRPNILRVGDTIREVIYRAVLRFDLKGQKEERLTVRGVDVDFDQLNADDWLILRALYPRGPEKRY